MTVVLKLGGSVITQKDEPETVDRAALSDAVSAVAESAVGDDIVVVHGGGSFGHHHAAEYGVSTTEGTHDGDGVRAIHGAMCRLNAAVVEALTDAGVPAVPVHPFSAAARDADGGLSLPAAQVTTLLGEGFVPVLHGDLVAHAGAGATVLSGDELVVELAPAVNADRVGVCSTVSGVLDDDGTVIDRIETFEAVASALGESEATDVSGGMAGKVRALLALSAPALVFGPDALPAFLAGESPGTTIAGGDAD
ncbi:isopentenyl phosphate kinase [Haloarcula sp. Atlit-7R]|uniref:isopentenyl phosphate kinase n=1 Tax=Haloarcula sp. Atlit-7R TaxID=2282125 RepID=UPI000EF14A07|nr:isopentenyl phosphate kinase [Haloarcula sp. Atlit-7R]RLN01554.1 acetylglutamate kinase [Haloarcula sp. Atlit-7R]